jgi:S1-C subfamily serine protease
MSPTWSNTLRTIILSLAIGGGAGVVAAAFTSAYLDDYAAQLAALSGPLRLSEERPRTVPSELDEVLDVVRERAFSSVVEIHRGPNASGAYESTNAVGSGVVITSDGWIVAAPSLSAGEAAAVKIVVGRDVYAVQTVVKDARAGVLYLKIDATNLPVLAFGDAHELAVGDSLFIVPSKDTLVVASLTTFARVIPASGVEVEAISRRLELSEQVVSAQTGAPVLNASGELVGIIEAHAPPVSSGKAIAMNALEPAIHSLLKEGKALRPAIGLTIMDLTRAIGVSDAVSRGFARGALVQGVDKGSAAALAGVVVADIVLEVEGEQVNGGKTFDELLAAFAPGEVVTLTIDREGESLRLDVTLASE